MKKIRDTSDKNDLTQGPILSKLLLFFLPIAAGTLFQQLYNAVDAFVVSKYVGTGALAAVGGSPATLTNLIIGFCTALSGGAAVVIAQLYGAREKEKASAAVKTSMVFCVVLGAVVSVIVIILSPALLTVLSTPDDIFDDALLYLRIYYAGCVLALVFNMGAGILRAVGNSRFPFICLFVSCGANIVLDILFVAVLGLGVAGVAWATVIAELISTVMVLIALLTTKDFYRLRLTGARFDFPLLGRMLGIGIPSGIQSSMYGFSNLILQAGVNSLGTTVIASWAMSGKIDGVYWALTSALGTAVTTFIGQNYGAKRLDRLHRCTRVSLMTHFIMTDGVIAFIFLCGRFILNILTDDGDVVETTLVVMRYIVPAYVLWSAIEIFSAVLRGIGDTAVPTVISVIGICASRLIWVYTMFRAYHTLETLCLCYAVSWALTMGAMTVYYIIRAKRLDREMAS